VCLTTAGIYDELDAHLESLGLTCECLGGGKIEHNPHEKSIIIFGTSQVVSLSAAVSLEAFKVACNWTFMLVIPIYILLCF